MKRTLLFAALAAASFFGTGVAGAASFTYHGNLQDAGKPADGKYDIELTLYSAKTGGSVIGGPLTLYSVPVRDGSFSTDADFGPLAKAFSQAYVGVKVRTAGTGTFAPLDDLAPVTPDTNTSCPGSWSLDGNAGNPSGSYLGTGDTQPLILKTDAAQVVISDLGDGGTVPRWIGGGSLNNSTAGEGAFIGGGGSNTAARNKNSIGAFGVVTGGAGNSASGTTTDISGGITGYATVGGGQFNKASGYAATVAGGGGTTGSGGTTTTGNNASARGATIGGGQNNLASGVWATVAGGYGNVASGISATVAGGGDPGTECNINESKPCGNSASGNYSAVAGGEGNVALGNYSFAAGINSYAGGCQSVAMGTNSLVRDGAMAGVNCGDAGTFVWSGQYGGMESSGDDQFLVLAIGGVGINTTPVNSDVEIDHHGHTRWQ
jgi:trimeric autotransporter adhesin